MIDDIENKKEYSTLEMLHKKLVILEVSYFARRTYEIETVNSGLCYIMELRIMSP